jgi:hypothetical protein
MTYYWLECDCGHPGHAIRVEFDSEYGYMYIVTCIPYRPSFWSRLWQGLKYIFMGASVVHADSMLNENQVYQLKGRLENFLNDLDKVDEKE